MPHQRPRSSFCATATQTAADRVRLWAAKIIDALPDRYEPAINRLSTNSAATTTRLLCCPLKRRKLRPPDETNRDRTA